jgi:hypothetical protein
MNRADKKQYSYPCANKEHTLAYILSALFSQRICANATLFSLYGSILTMCCRVTQRGTQIHGYEPYPLEYGISGTGANLVKVT